MSLNPKKQKALKRISVVGTEEDRQALADVLKQAYEMFNIDLTGKNKNIPTRIVLSDEAEPEAINYPRTAKALKALVSALEKEIPISDDEQTMPISIGDVDWMWNDPTRVDSPISVRVLQSISRGKNLVGLRPIDPAKHYAGQDIMQKLDSMLDYSTGKWPKSLEGQPGGANGIFEVLKPEWTYIQTVDVFPVLSKKWKGKELSIQEIRELEHKRRDGVDVYPPELGVTEDIKGKRTPFTQVLTVAFRGDRDLDQLEKINVDSRAWGNFVKSLPPGLLAKELIRDKPKTIGDMLKVFIAYNAASYTKFRNVAVKPLGPGRSSIFTELIDGRTRGEMPAVQLGQTPPRDFKEHVLYSALVVGTGDFDFPTYDMSNIRHEDEIPGWK